MNGCQVNDCSRIILAKGLCGMHYQRWANKGSFNAQSRYPGSPDERFWKRVDLTDSCWLWTGGQVGKGYGVFRGEKRSTLVHRYVYELVKGVIFPNMEIDHLCKVRHCVNPEHLEMVTHTENMIRSDNFIGKRMAALI